MRRKLSSIFFFIMNKKRGFCACGYGPCQLKPKFNIAWGAPDAWAWTDLGEGRAPRSKFFFNKFIIVIIYFIFVVGVFKTLSLISS